MSTIPVLTLDAFEVAGILHVDVRTLRRMVSRKQMPPPIRVGDKRILWRVSDIEEFIRNGGTPGMPRKGRPRSGYVPDGASPSSIVPPIPPSPLRGRPRGGGSTRRTSLASRTKPAEVETESETDTFGPR